MATKNPPPALPSPTTLVAEASAIASLRYGYTALLVFALGGLSLEFLHLIKAPWYLDDPLRRELWVLGHAHGGLLAILNLAFAASLKWLPTAAAAGRFLRWGAALLPLGFLLGGVGNTEGDPSLMIALAPVGAVAILLGLLIACRAAWLMK
jgi:hypothetical protein